MTATVQFDPAMTKRFAEVRKLFESMPRDEQSLIAEQLLPGLVRQHFRDLDGQAISGRDLHLAFDLFQQKVGEFAVIAAAERKMFGDFPFPGPIVRAFLDLHSSAGARREEALVTENG